MKNDLKKLRANFTPMYRDATNKCPAWYAMDSRARALFVEIKLLFDRVGENAVGMSYRQAAKLLGVGTKTATKMLAQAAHYGFLVKIADGYLGTNGKGIATQWRLTDEPYLGTPATLDFTRWDGTLFEEKSRAKKTKPRGRHDHRPVGATTTPRGRHDHVDSTKSRKNGKTEKQPPVGATTTFLRSSPSLEPAKPVGVSEVMSATPVGAEPTSAPPGWASWLPSDLASLVVVAWFYVGVPR